MWCDEMKWDEVKYNKITWNWVSRVDLISQVSWSLDAELNYLFACIADARNASPLSCEMLIQGLEVHTHVGRGAPALFLDEALKGG